jgi:hypothetical protein
LNIISEDLKEFIHTHPGAAGDGHDHEHSLNIIREAQAQAGDGHTDHSHSAGNVDTSHGVPFQVTFPKPGLYKVYAQFAPKGASLKPDQALVAAYYINVVEPTGFDFSSAKGKIILTLISLVLMYGLVRGVKKYLKVEAGQDAKKTMP